MTTDDDWKQRFANDAEKALDHDLVKGVIDEQIGNLNREGDSLARYGLTKIAMYAATVARAQALGIDPELLRLTSQEVTSNQLRLAAEATYRGVPTFMIEASEDDA